MRMVCGFLCSIYAVHDEAKDKAFELEMSWICDESNREHERVNKIASLCKYRTSIMLWKICNICIVSQLQLIR